MELQRLLQSQGFGSRAECRDLIRAGSVEVNGQACTNPAAQFETAGLCFSVAGEAWVYRQLAYLALNKPAGYECSHRPQHHRSVFSLLPQVLTRRGVQAVGRLDADTTGLLLLTDDGEFIHNYSAPRKRVPKVYEIDTRHPVDAAQAAALLDGVLLHDESRPIAATACELLGEKRLRLTVTLGKYHLVKRMLAAVGNRVETLHRAAIGGLALPPDLPAGRWIWLEAPELARLACHDCHDGQTRQ